MRRTLQSRFFSLALLGLFLAAGICVGGDDSPKATFAGTADTRSMVFLCDATGSMINKMAALKSEVRAAIHSLKPTQSFDMVFYQDLKVDPFAPALIPATAENKAKADDFLDGFISTGTSDPIPPMIKALQLKPEAIYFVTDAADFPDTQGVFAA